LLPSDETVRAAMVAFTGPPAGVEGLLAPLAGIVGGALGGLVGVGGVNRARRFVTLAVTDSGAVRFKNEGLRRPTAIEGRYELNAFGTMNEAVGDFWLEFAGTRYYFEGIWCSQLWRIRRLL
jgi:hypothetical protein